jgi:4-amino-4-deoxy-L-arabinose transferase-like glycosyltransferase
MFGWTRRDRILVASIMLVASLLLFARLDDRSLWQDEAETALLGRSVLTYGVPTAFDGRNIISQEGQREFEAPDYTWFWTPWAQHYMAAASFGLFGVSTFTARLPFVLLAIGCLYLCYLLAYEVTQDRRTAAIALVLLGASVPFLLHARQCRYYSPACFFACLFVLSYLRILKGKKGAAFWLAFGATGLFHSHYVVFGGFVLGLALHYFLLSRDVTRLRAISIAASITIALAIPFLIGFEGQSSGQALPGLEKSLSNLHSALYHINRYVFPCLLGIPLVGLWLLNRRGSQVAVSADSCVTQSALALTLVVVATVAVLVVVMPWFFFRYYVALIPIAVVLQAVIVMQIWRWRRWVGVALFMLLAATDVVSRALPINQNLPTKSVRHFLSGDEDLGTVIGAWAQLTPMAGYLYEISHDYTGPIEELIKYLEGRTSPGDTILATYGDLPIQFYTGLKVVGGLSEEDPSRYSEAEWLFVRAHTHRQGDRRLKRFIAKAIDRSAYEPATLDVLDRPYENRPDPTTHKWRSPSEGLPSAKVWRRVEASTQSSPQVELSVPTMSGGN